MTERVGQQLGNYRLKRLLGKGGFAEVYLGEHVYLGTQAAIKVLRLRLATDERATFLHEARTIAHLEHPHIIHVLDFGMEEDMPFLIMGYAPQGSVRQRHPKGTTLSMMCIISYVKQIAAALQYAHDHKLIHRDVKPENLLLDHNETLLLSDFGIAVVAQSSQHDMPQKVVGTLAYMAPEQFQGKPCFASDQYALGIVVYEWLCGTRPFNGSPAELAIQHMHMPPPGLHEKNPAIPSAVEEVLLKTLGKDPRQRYANMQEFATALEEASQPQHVIANSLPLSFPSSTEHALKAEAVSPHASVWNIPFRRNPFFTGREEVLTHLYETLTATKAAALTQPQAVSGLGGLGKTQTVIEYAYRYRASYRALFWVRADTYETLLSDFVTIASLLNLPEKDEQDQSRTAAAVKRWFNHHTDWLLIFDNVEDIAMASEFTPTAGRGHILLTTRAYVTGTLAQCIDLEKMGPEEGALFLLRRAKRISHDALLEEASAIDRSLAREISQIMDGLPLAIDQAGAYIEEVGCSLSDYLDRYQSRRALLLDLRGRVGTDHPQSVVATVSLSFERIEQANPAAADLLHLCAFLHPDAIPEEIITEGASALGATLQPVAIDPFKRDGVFAELRTYSLLRRDPDTKTLSIHRLVQAVLKDRMNEDLQHQWAERTVRAVNLVFPDSEVGEVAKWPRCQRCLPHAHTCASLINQWGIASAEAGRLLNRAGVYLVERGHYTQAEVFLKKACDISMQALGPEHPDVAASLHALALLYTNQGKYSPAEQLFQRELAIREKALGPEHSDVADSLAETAVLYYFQGKFVQAELFYQRALHIQRQIAGPEDALIAACLNNLAVLYHYQGKYEQAESFLKQALAIDEKISGLEHPETAFDLNNLARLYRDQGKYIQAERLFQQTLAIREQLLGTEHPLVAETLSDWARLCYYMGKYVQGESICKRAIVIWEQTIGTKHPRIAQTFNNLAMLYHAQGKYAQAEDLYQQALGIREQTLGPAHPKVAHTLSNLAMLYYAQGKHAQAEPLLLQALPLYKQALGPVHPRVAECLTDLSLLSLIQGKYAQAESHIQSAVEIFEKTLGVEHPQMAQSLNCRARLHVCQGNYTQAESLFQHVLGLRERIFGPEHPHVAESLYHLARLYHQQKKYDQAEPLYHRTLTIYEKNFGSERPEVVTVLKHYATLLWTLQRKDEATKLLARIKALQVEHALHDLAR